MSEANIIALLSTTDLIWLEIWLVSQNHVHIFLRATRLLSLQAEEIFAKN